MFGTGNLQIEFDLPVLQGQAWCESKRTGYADHHKSTGKNLGRFGSRTISRRLKLTGVASIAHNDHCVSTLYAIIISVFLSCDAARLWPGCL